MALRVVRRLTFVNWCKLFRNYAGIDCPRGGTFEAKGRLSVFPLFGYHVHGRRAGHRAWDWNRSWSR